jgi:multicomponent Na+:H+ antiporter subunit E
MAALLTEFLIAFVFSVLFYLALTAGSGNVMGLWSIEELEFGAIFSLPAALFAARLMQALGIRRRLSIFNPARWLAFIAYLAGPFFIAMARANLDVAYRVITGKIRPGIVRISPGLRTDFATAFLANSITLTPGTLSVEVGEGNDLYVHWINVTDKEPGAEAICGSFPKWARRIAE